MSDRTAPIDPAFAAYLKSLRPTLRRRLGEHLHPESVTDAWYATNCPPVFNPRPHVSRRDYVAWRTACRLRGAR